VILRRLSQSLKEQNWTAILIEFVLLVVGVFLGIQASNWNEARIGQARTKQALDAFRVDMRDQMRVAGKFGDMAAKCLAAFYDERGELKPEYRQNMQRLREWVEDNDVLAVSAECLLKRFDAPKAPGQSCRPDYGHLDGKAATP